MLFSFNEEAIEELRQIAEVEFRMAVTTAEAQAIAHNLIELHKLLAPSVSVLMANRSTQRAQMDQSVQ